MALKINQDHSKEDQTYHQMKEKEKILVLKERKVFLEKIRERMGS